MTSVKTFSRSRKKNVIISRKEELKIALEEFSDEDISSDNEELETPDFEIDRKYGLNEPRAESLRKINSFLCVLLVILPIILVIISVIIYAIIYMRFSSTNIRNFPRNLDEMKKEFPLQTEISWKILNNSLAKQILRTKPPEKPSVIVLVGPHEKVEQFLVSLISVVLGKCPTYSRKVDTENADDLKLDLSGFIDKLVSERTNCAYLPEIDNISPSLGPFLQGLTDELNAKYKDMIYIFSFKLQSNNQSSESLPKTDKEAETLLLNQLSSKWEDEQGTERFLALHTRLVVNVIAVI